jgi:hypothetical protein
MKYGVVLLLLVAAMAQGQTIMYVDSALTVPAQVYAYKLATAPTIDGNGAEWSAIPWNEAFFNDRDRNNDDLMDPFVHRNDQRATYKTAWVSGVKKLFMLVNFRDDKWFPLSRIDSSDVYNCDGLELRFDPLNLKLNGEEGDGTIHYIILEYGKARYISKGGVTDTTNYSAAWTVDTLSYPKRATLELSLNLPASVAPAGEYTMGFYPYFNDNDGFVGKTSASVLWPQLWSAKDGSRLSVDAAWADTWKWGELKMVDQTVTNATSAANLTSALNGAKEGDIIKLAAGTYIGNWLVNFPGVSIIGADSGSVILRPAVDSLPVVWVKPGSYNTRIEGVKFLGNQIGGAPSSKYALKIEAGVAQVLNNVVMDFSTGGILCSANEGANVIYGNRVYNVLGDPIVISDAPFTAVRYNSVIKGGSKIISKVTKNVRASAVDISFNTLKDFSSGSVGIPYGVSGSVLAANYTWTIHHNTIFVPYTQRTLGGADYGDNALENQENNTVGSVSYIYNNTFLFMKNCSIQMNGPKTNRYNIANNIMAWNSRQREKIWQDFDIRPKPGTAAADSPAVSIMNTICFGVSGTQTNWIGAAPYNTPSLGNKEVDPAFVDTLGDNFALKSASPARDAGIMQPFGFKFGYVGSAPDLGAVEYGEQTATSVEPYLVEGVAEVYSLSQNYPNPFNPTTTIQYSVPKAGTVSLHVYNVIGQLVSTLVNQVQSAGTYNVQFDASRLASGVYFYNLTAGSFNSTKKMVIMK